MQSQKPKLFLKAGNPAKLKLLLIGVILLLLAGGVPWFFLQLADDYSGCLTGLVPEETGSSLAVLDPFNEKVKTILRLPEVAPDNFGAVSPDGRYAAYTQWNETGTVRFLTVSKLTGIRKTSEYFKNVSGMQEVVYLSWFPDSKRLLFVKKDVTEAFPYEEVGIFDVKSEKYTAIDRGGIWNGRSREIAGGQESWVSYITQSELNDLTSKYGGRETPVEGIGRKLWVEFTKPSASPDGEKISYSAILVKSAPGDGPNIPMASGIWLADVNSGQPRRIYSNPDPSYSLGKTVWTGGNTLAFLQHRVPGKEEERIDYLDMSLKHIKTIVHSTNGHFTNNELLAMPGNELSFLSAPLHGSRNDATRYIVNIDTGEIKPQNININPRGKQLRNFSNLY
ncbi:MAG: hypothetical protein ACOY46_03300 [Bacillota bacterium]